MADPRHEQWAQTLVEFSVAVQPGQTVAISGGVAAEPLMRRALAIYRTNLGDNHPNTLVARKNYQRLQNAMNAS